MYTWVESFERIITNLKVALKLLKHKRWMCELANIMISIFLEEGRVSFYIDYRSAWDYTFTLEPTINKYGTQLCDQGKRQIAVIEIRHL